MYNPVEHLTVGLPRIWRTAIEWLLTLVGALVLVLAVKQWIVNPYRIPSSSMEPTLHCARPGVGCEASQRRVDRPLRVRELARARVANVLDDRVAVHRPRAQRRQEEELQVPRERLSRHT